MTMNEKLTTQRGWTTRRHRESHRKGVLNMLDVRTEMPTAEDKCRADAIKEIAGRLPDREQEKLLMLAKCLELIGSPGNAMTATRAAG